MTFRIDVCISFAELMFSNCFEEGPLLDRHTDLHFRVLEYWSGFSGT